MATDVLSVSFSGKSLQSASTLLSECRRLGISTDSFFSKANSLSRPRGTKYGRGYLLLLYEDLKTLDLNSTDHDLTFTFNNNTYKFECLTILESYSPIPSGVITDTSIYVVEVADRRYWGEFSSVNASYNILQPDDSTVYSDTQNSGSDWTWQTMFNNLWSLLPEKVKNLGGLTLTPTLPTDKVPSSNPSNYSFLGVTVWDAIGEVLNDLNLHLTMHPDGTFEVVVPDVDDTKTKTNRTTAINNDFLIDHEQPVLGSASRIPETVRVFFPYRNTTFLQAFSKDIAVSSIDSSLTTVSGTVLTVWDNLEALHDGDSTPSNDSALTTRATDLATNRIKADYSNKRSLEVFSGIHDLRPGAVYSNVSWQNVGMGWKTEGIRAEREQAGTKAAAFPNTGQGLIVVKWASGQFTSDVPAAHPSTPTIEKDRRSLAQVSGTGVAIQADGDILAYVSVRFGDDGASGNLRYSSNVEPIKGNVLSGTLGTGHTITHTISLANVNDSSAGALQDYIRMGSTCSSTFLFEGISSGDVINVRGYKATHPNDSDFTAEVMMKIMYLG